MYSDSSTDGRLLVNAKELLQSCRYAYYIYRRDKSVAIQFNMSLRERSSVIGLSMGIRRKVCVFSKKCYAYSLQNQLFKEC